MPYGDELPPLARVGLRLIRANIGLTVLGYAAGAYGWWSGELRPLMWYWLLGLWVGVPLFLLQLLLSPAYTLSLRAAVGAGTRRYRCLLLLSLGLVVIPWFGLPLLVRLIRALLGLF